MAKFKNLLGSKIDMKAASEPSDIIWENRQFSKNGRRSRLLVAYIITFLLLGLSGILIYELQTWSMSIKNKYPKMDCLSDTGLIKT
jgi:hypothetical protein